MNSTILTRKPARRARRGFQLVEILIVLLIIGILLGVAVPQLLSSRGNAADRAAQTQLSTASRAAQAQFSDTEDFSTATSTDIQNGEPNLTVVGGTTAAANNAGLRQVSVFVSTDKQVWIAASPGDKGVCWFIRLEAGKADGFAKSTGTCSGSAASSGFTNNATDSDNSNDTGSTANTWYKKFPSN